MRGAEAPRRAPPGTGTAGRGEVGSARASSVSLASSAAGPLPAAERLMRVTVKTVQGDSVQMELQPTTTVLETVRRAAAQFGVEQAASSLVFRGRVLQGVEMIRDAGIVDGSCAILARQRPRHASTASPPAAQPEAEHATPSSPEVTLTIKRVGSEGSTRVSVETSDTLQAIIRQLKWRWDVGDVRLVHGGRILHPGQRVSESGLRDGMAIFGMASQATVVPAAAEAAASAIHGDGGSDEDDQGPRPEARDQSETRRRTSGDEAETCRICHGGRELESELGPLFSPCRCRGSVASVHVECLNRWRRMSANPSSFFACDQCGYRYQVDRTRWAQWAETGAAAEVTAVLACAFMVCFAAFPCYGLSLHKHFYSLCSLVPYWQSSEWAPTLDFLAAGLIGTSAVFYSLWVYSLYRSGNFPHMFHLGLTVVANGTRIFRLLALSGSLMAWRAVHAQVRVSARMVMQRFGERLREAPPLDPATSTTQT